MKPMDERDLRRLASKAEMLVRENGAAELGVECKEDRDRLLAKIPESLRSRVYFKELAPFDPQL